MMAVTLMGEGVESGSHGFGHVFAGAELGDGGESDLRLGLRDDGPATKRPQQLHCLDFRAHQPGY